MADSEETPLTELIDRGRRIEKLLNGSGEFWVEAHEIDGGTTWRADVSDKRASKWFTLTVESNDEPED